MSDEPEISKKRIVEQSDGSINISDQKQWNQGLFGRLVRKREKLKKLNTEIVNLKSSNSKLNFINSRLKSNWEKFWNDLDVVTGQFGEPGCIDSSSFQYVISRYRNGADSLLRKILEEAREKLDQIQSYIEQKQADIGKSQSTEITILELNNKIDNLENQLSCVATEWQDTKERIDRTQDDMGHIAEDYRLLKDEFEDTLSLLETLDCRLAKTQGNEVAQDVDNAQLSQDVVDAQTVIKDRQRGIERSVCKSIDISYKHEVYENRFIQSHAFRTLKRQTKMLQEQLEYDRADNKKRSEHRPRSQSFRSTIDEALETMRGRNVKLSNKMQTYKTDLSDAKKQSSSKSVEKYTLKLQDVNDTMEHLKETLATNRGTKKEFLQQHDALVNQVSEIQNQVADKETRILHLGKRIIIGNDIKDPNTLQQTIKTREDRVTYLEQVQRSLDAKYKNEHANNEALQGEIDVLEKAYADSCKKNHNLVHGLAEKDTQFASLMTERMKDSNLKELLDQEQFSLEERVAASEQQLESYKEITENLQAKVLENEKLGGESKLLDDVNSQIQAIESKVTGSRSEELEKEKDTLKASLSTLEQSIVKDQQQKSTLYGELSSKELTIEKMEKQLSEALSKEGVISSDDRVNEQLINYRKMTSCSVCNNNMIDSLITKCFHVFCHQCLQDNQDKRIRKCPICKELFGFADIKPFYWI